MLLLLDTHIAFWAATKPERLSRAAQRAIAAAERSDGLAIASISLWELAVLIENGRLQVASSTERFLERLCETKSLTVLEITAEIAVLSMRSPPGFPDDPADRLIGATARAHRLALVTKDQALQDCSLLKTIW